jgi:hypothetical protein
MPRPTVDYYPVTVRLLLPLSLRSPVRQKLWPLLTQLSQFTLFVCLLTKTALTRAAHCIQIQRLRSDSILSLSVILKIRFTLLFSAHTIVKILPPLCRFYRSTPLPTSHINGLGKRLSRIPACSRQGSMKNPFSLPPLAPVGKAWYILLCSTIFAV